MNRFIALVLLAVGFTTAARADYIPASWTDSANVGSGVYIGSGQSYSYTHNLTDDGFRPLHDWVERFHLSISLADDDGSWRDGIEWAVVDLPGVGGDESIIGNFSASGGEYGGWSVLGLLQLNVFGTLTVTISSVLGDFNLVGSTLSASGLRDVPSVPEPGALGLLGVGLLGMAVSMRRRKQANRG